MKMKDVGLKIKRLREANRLSQSALSYELGISQTTICNIESGSTKSIDFAILGNICRFFRVNFDYFLDTIPKENKQNQRDDITDGYFEGIIHQIKTLIEENRALRKENEELKKFL